MKPKLGLFKAGQTGGPEYKKPGEYLQKVEIYLSGAKSGLKGERPYEKWISTKRKFSRLNSDKNFHSSSSVMTNCPQAA